MNKVAKIFSYIAFVSAFCCMAIGYAAVQDELLVTGSVSVRGYKPMAELSCADIDGYDFDPITGVVTIKERYLDTQTGINYNVYGIAKNGFSGDAIRAATAETDSKVTLDATKITGFALPGYLVTIGDNAFTGLANITTFKVDSANETFTVDDNILFNADKTMIVRYPSGNRSTYYTVPEHVTSIRSDAFCDNSYCTAIITTMYDTKAWGLPSGIMLNIDNLADTITSITGNVTGGYTISLEKTEHGKGIVIQGNDDPAIDSYGQPKNMPVEGQSMTIPSEYCQPNSQAHYAQIYLSSWKTMAYAYLQDGTLEFHNCETAIVGGEIYQWVRDGDENHRVINNALLYNLPSNAGDFNPLPENYASWNDLTKSSVLKVKVVDSIAPTSVSGWFSEMEYCTTMDLAQLDTKYITSMQKMFYHCYRLEALDLSHFNTSSVTNMDSMFMHCNALKTLNIANFDTSKVDDMLAMFSYCYALTSLDVSSFDTQGVKNMQSMFIHCRSLKKLDLSKFNTSNATNMSIMFAETHSLVTLNLSSFNTERVTMMNRMFENCYQLTKLDISTFNTSKVADMTNMFKGSNSLKTITVSDKFILKRDTTATDMFLTCTALVGGNGTTYDSNYVGKTYARIDGVNGQHGYFTAATDVTVPPANVQVAVDSTVAESFTTSWVFLGENITVTLTGIQEGITEVALTGEDQTATVTVANGVFTIPAAFVTDGATINVTVPNSEAAE